MNIGEKAAAIDIGTHSVRMLIGRFDGNGFCGEKRLVITRLGQGLAKSGVLHPEAVRRTADAVGEFVVQAKHEGVLRPVYCYATSAAREASNGGELIAQLSSIDGLVAEIIDGQTEALLSYAGAAALGDVVMDIGGGSTELARNSDGAFCSFSVPLGTVTLLERFLDEYDAIGPLTVIEMAYRAQPLVDKLCATVLKDSKAESLVGVGGTATQLAMLFLQLPQYDGNRVNGHRMSFANISALQARLVNMTSKQRMEMPGMHPKRADVIVAGCLIARMMMAACGAQTLIASDFDGLDAYLLKMCS